MKNFVCALALSLVFAPGCGDDGDGTDPDTPDANTVDDDVVEISQDISADETWTADKQYILAANVFVRDATLTIEAGTVIKGNNDSSLVITNTAQINAVGTASAPIVFTSNQPDGARASGDWGGVTLLGTAPINVAGGTDNIEGFPAGTDGTEFGGMNASHDCGTMNYVRIEFAGFELSPDNELNGLTLGGCGTDTELDFIQVHKGNDDGVEFFGGTASISHLLVSQPDDDGLDWDFGWSGNAQFVIIQQNAVVGNQGFECDNNGNNNDATPRSSPTIYNATLVGSNAEPGMAGKTQGGLHLRRGTAGTLRNFILTGFTDYAINISDLATVQQYGAGLSIEFSYFFDNANDDNNGWPAGFDDDGGEDDCDGAGMNCFDEAAEIAATGTNNSFADPGLSDAFNLEAPDFAPMAGAPVLTGGDTPPNDPFFDRAATFIGAIGADDWTVTWTAFPAN